MARKETCLKNLYPNISYFGTGKENFQNFKIKNGIFLAEQK